MSVFLFVNDFISAGWRGGALPPRGSGGSRTRLGLGKQSSGKAGTSKRTRIRLRTEHDRMREAIDLEQRWGYNTHSYPHNRWLPPSNAYLA